MKQLKTNVEKLTGTLKVPGDKSISHRAVMLGAIAKGKTTIKGFLPGEDCFSTINCFEKMGVSIQQNEDEVIVEGNGLEGLHEPSEILDVGNSGTTTRLMLGILATRSFHCVVIGDKSISKRPMSRVTKPLIMMGAKIDGRNNGDFAPISIRGGNLNPINNNSPVASAQVKSCVLLAGLGASGSTSHTEPSLSRDHTERMLQAFGVGLNRNGLTVSIEGGQSLKATDIIVPGDISSAAFFLVAGAIIPNSEIRLNNVGMNPTRTGIIDVLLEMDADLSIMNEREQNNEPVADLIIRTSQLKGIEISGDLIPRLIDEIPIIALLATQAQGTTVIKDAGELKVKETNRIDTVVTQFEKLGANIKGTDDGMIIEGKTQLQAADVDSFGDHRIGMTMAIAACVVNGDMRLENESAIAVSYPNFFDDLNKLMNKRG